MAFQSYIDPIENLVSRYFEKRRTLSDNEPQNGGELLESGGMYNAELPENPCKLLRDEKGRVYKCIYGEFEELSEEDDGTQIIWQQEIIRDASGKTIAIEATYPDGSTSTETLVRENGKVTGIL